jgi:hypothetical protein
MIREVLQKPEANAFFSFVIGLGIACLLFHRDRKTYIIPAMNVKDIPTMVSKIDNKCYRFRVTDASEPTA